VILQRGARGTHSKVDLTVDRTYWLNGSVHLALYGTLVRCVPIALANQSAVRSRFTFEQFTAPVQSLLSKIITYHAAAQQLDAQWDMWEHPPKRSHEND
jgi:hypothetical protein